MRVPFPGAAELGAAELQITRARDPTLEAAGEDPPHTLTGRLAAGE